MEHSKAFSVFLLIACLSVSLARETNRQLDRQLDPTFHHGNTSTGVALLQQSTGLGVKWGFKATSEAWLCGMLTIQIAGGIVEISVGTGLKAVLEVEKLIPQSISIKGFIGGGITIGPPKIFSGAIMVMREVSATLNLPNTLKVAATNVWKAAKWAVQTILGWEGPKTSMGRLAKIAATKKAAIVDIIEKIPAALNEAEFKNTKTGKIISATLKFGDKDYDVITHDLHKQLTDSLVLLSENLIKELKALVKGKTAMPAMAAHKAAIQQAYWSTYMNSAQRLPDSKKAVQDCKTVHLRVPSSKSSGHKAGFQNILCTFMTNAFLIAGKKLTSGFFFKTDKGYSNTIDMIDIVLAKLSPEDLGEVYGATLTEAAMGTAIDDFIETLKIGTWQAAASSPIVLRSVGEILIMDPAKVGGALDAFVDLEGLMQDGDNRCAAAKNKADSTCGMVAYTVETTFSATLGWGGGINFCTPDTSLVQYHYMRKYVYTRKNGKKVMDLDKKERSHKVLLAGSIYFMIELNFKAKPFTVDDIVLRVMVPTTEQISGDEPPAPGNAETQAKFDAFFVQTGKKFADAVSSAMDSLGKLKDVASAAVKTAKDNFFDGLKAAVDAPPSGRRRLLMHQHQHQNGTSLALVDQDLKAFNWAKGMAVGIPLTMAIFKSVAGKLAKASLSAVSPVEVYVNKLVGGEITFHRKDKKWSGVTGGIFYIKYIEAKASTAPWLALAGLGFDVSVGGYAGTAAKLEITIGDVA